MSEQRGAVPRPEPCFTFAPWELCAQPPGAITNLAQLAANARWMSAEVPGTVASALRSQGKWDFSRPADLDGQDWWYRTQFSLSPPREGDPLVLCCDGLATLAEVWLNGERVLATNNMFRQYRVDISTLARDDNELVLGFRSLQENLKQKRPRPKWKTNLVNHQQLRWIRTSLQGRIPGWSPPVPAVGPWRGVRLESSAEGLADFQLRSELRGTDGIVTLNAGWHGKRRQGTPRLRVGEHEVAVSVLKTPEGWQLQATLHIANPPLWWPHTHGPQHLLQCELEWESEQSFQSFSLGQIGFRTMEVDSQPAFGIKVNRVPIYCRGACWTTPDMFTLSGNESTLRHDLQLAVDAGMNMLRVGGTMAYESDRFYELCDELGILVWQDFMFANMDYPVADEAFLANIDAEARQQLARLAPHPSVAVYCGNSEVEQQAAMLGVPRELWRNHWFGEQMPALCQELHPGAAYVPSTPSGGVMPFHLQAGVAHYYGVGAYLRSPQELRAAKVGFTPECLGFANIPEPETIDALTGGALPVMHSPLWKQRVPRDSGPGWDFEDVRDFYLKERFGVDPVQLRSFDIPRYLQLSRAVSGEMMALTFAEWRSAHSVNRGGLVWYFKDLWPGAGWGLVDSTGLPKAAYYYVRRAWTSQQVTLTDEGLEGLHVHLINEQAEALSGIIEVALLKEPDIVVAKREIAVQLDPRSRQFHSVDGILDAFYDVNYAYRFGPPHHDVVIATLYDAQRQVISEAFHFVHRRDPVQQASCLLNSSVQPIGGTGYVVTLQSERFLDTVRLAARGFLPNDNYFHLPPGRSKTVTFRPFGERPKSFQPTLEALNLREMQFLAVTEAGR